MRDTITIVGGLSNYDDTSLQGRVNNIENIVADLSNYDDSSLQNRINIIEGDLSNKAPNNHSSTSTTYGIGTFSNYGHTKIINNLEENSYQDGTALSAYQGKVLNDKVSLLEEILYSAGLFNYNGDIYTWSDVNENYLNGLTGGRVYELYEIVQIVPQHRNGNRVILK